MRLYEESLSGHRHTIPIHGKLFGPQGVTLVPASSVFVMGDNRIMGIDIRDFAPPQQILSRIQQLPGLDRQTVASFILACTW